MKIEKNQLIEGLKKLNVYKADRVAYMYIRKDAPRRYPFDRLSDLTERISLIEGLLSIPPEHEAYVVKRRIIDGLQWAQVTHEYRIKWGDDSAKGTRMLMRYQDAALRKMLDHVNQRKNVYANVFLDHSAQPML